jgi:PAS domain S-box-containing protein
MDELISLKGKNDLGAVVDQFRKNLILYLKNNSLDKPKGQNLNILTAKGKNFKYGIRLVDNNGIIIAANKSFFSLFEVDEKELIGKSNTSVYNKNNSEDLEELLALFNRDLLKINIDYYFDKFVVTTNGKALFIEGINTFIDVSKFGMGNFGTLLLTIFRDVMEEKLTSNSKVLHEALQNPSQDAIINTDLNGIITSWNTGAEKIYGYSAIEVIGKSISILFSLDRRNELKKIIEQIKNRQNIDNYETINKKKDGILVQVLSQITPVKDNIGSLYGVTIISRDISAQKRTEIKLRKNEEMYRTLIETSPDAILMLDLNGKILMSNKQVADTLGFESIEEIQLQNIFSFFKPSDRKRIFRDARKVIESGILKNCEYTVIRKNGEEVPVEINASLILDILGKPDGIIGIMRDITNRKKAEEAIINSELRFRSIWENSNDGMRLTDFNGTIIAVNKAYCALVGLKEEDLIRKPFFVIYSKDECSDSIKLLNEYKEKFINRIIKPNIQTGYKYWKTDYVVLMESYSFIYLERGEPLLLGIFHDITEMKKNEEELRNAEKFAAIGKQAAILSHEIKSPLASIKMNLDMLFNNLNMSESKQKSYQIIQKEIKRLETLLKNVLLYSRELNLVFLPVDLEKLVDNIKDLMKPVLNEQNISLHNYLASLRIKGDFRNLQTVFLHMIENSIESMPKGGVIEIYSKQNDEDKCSVFIKDTGCGIIENEKIFDPFFTTKSSGTGLGLAIASNIIKQHNGELKLISSRQGETIFEIIFINKDME